VGSVSTTSWNFVMSSTSRPSSRSESTSTGRAPHRISWSAYVWRACTGWSDVSSTPTTDTNSSASIAFSDSGVCPWSRLPGTIACITDHDRVNAGDRSRTSGRSIIR
jgi:hypothetical protein